MSWPLLKIIANVKILVGFVISDLYYDKKKDMDGDTISMNLNQKTMKNTTDEQLLHSQDENHYNFTVRRQRTRNDNEESSAFEDSSAVGDVLITPVSRTFRLLEFVVSFLGSFSYLLFQVKIK